MVKKLGVFIIICIFLSAFSAFSASAFGKELSPGLKMAHQTVKSRKIWGTTDHSKHDALKQEFTSGDQITRACLSCHSEASDQFHKSIHWTWLDPNDPAGKTGKAGKSINNFCISTNGMNDKKCQSCHTGWNGKSGEVNCLICHGQEENFNWQETFDDLKYFMESDDEDSKEMIQEVQSNIQKAAQNISRPTRKNCGSCHFKGGGGDGVKHGDLDTSMTKPNKSLDVHMGEDGQNFKCTRCHTTRLHNIAGRVYSTPAAENRKSLVEDDLTPKIMCESCHSSKPHEIGSKENDHTDKVACQTCHIPKFAKVLPTKMWWDWSAAGKLKDGKPYTEEDELGKHSYMSIKGNMKWAKNVKPEYMWFNGSIHTLTAEDKIDPAETVKVSWPKGDAEDKNSRIFPFKIHRGKQPFDTENNTFLTPLLSGPNGYWTTFDWPDALKRGADFLNLPFSEKYDFAETSYVFPITHMVAPKSEALSCKECHVRDTSRMAGLGGFYMPGRDTYKEIHVIAWFLVIGSFVGVLFHGIGRMISGNKKEK